MSGSVSTGQGAQQYTAAQNYADRMTLLQTGVPMQTKLGTFGPYLLGSTAQIRLRNVGVITGLSLRFTANVTITGTPTANPVGPYGFVSSHQTTDYNTTQRVYASGPMVYLLNSVRHGRPWMPVGQGLVDTQQTAQPLTGTAVNVIWNVDIPFAVDAGNDLTGSVLAQTVVGEMFYRAQFVNAAVGDAWNAPYGVGSSGVVTVNSITIDAWQRYLQPQSAALPLMDLNTVYEFAGQYQTQNGITTNGQTFVDYPNVRSVLGSYFGFLDNSALAINGTDIASMTLIANGNTNMREQDPLDVRKHMRVMLGGDVFESFYIPSRRQPIQTWIYSQVQERFIWGTVTSSPAPALYYAFESIYPLNTPLPGIAAA